MPTKDETRRAYIREYNRKNADKIREQKRAYQQRNAERIKEQRRQYYLEHKDEFKARNQRQYERDPEGFNERNRENARNWAEAHPERVREKRRRAQARKYDLTLEEYDAILARGCAICATHSGRLCLDHDHTDGKVRAALCHNCNSGLGLFEDDPVRVRAAADYVAIHRS